MTDTIVMLREERDKWVEALRSGKYTQCRENWGLGFDERTDARVDVPVGFCCLNVLGYVLTGKTVYGPGNDAVDAIERSIGTNFTPFITLNDEDGLSFSEIADWIEKNVEDK